MTQLSEAGGGVTAASAAALARTLLGRFDGLVSPRILAPDERAAHARVIGGLVAAGLGASLLAPFAGLADLGMGAVVTSTILAGTVLALAALLASSGRLELVLSLTITLFAGLVVLAAVRGGGTASPFLWLLLVAPVEAAVAGRRTLAGQAVGIACLALGAVAMLDWLGASPGHDIAYGGLLTLTIGVLHAGLQMLRLMRARAAGRRIRDSARAEARLIEDALSDAVLRFSADGRLLSASGAAPALFCRDGAPLTETALLQRLHVTDRVRYLKAFGDIRAGCDRVGVEVRMGDGRAGEVRFADIVLTLIASRDRMGSLLAIICIARDVTAERAMTSDLRDALAEAQKSSDAKSHFLATVSHELRTPLNAIIGFSDVLDQEFFGSFENPRQKEYVGLIRQSGEHLLSVVNGLLDISKIEAGHYELHLEPFRIDEALMAAADVMRQEAENKGLRLELELTCGTAEIAADRRAFHQILLNLLSNAVKFTDKGVVTLGAELKAGRLIVTVRDTGIGIARQEIARLGRPFTQVSAGLTRRYPGTGLGLSLVKGLSELHHGTMTIASELGRGTTMTVEIPLDCQARIADQHSSKENIVALTHARKKTQPSPQDDRQTRRTA